MEQLAPRGCADGRILFYRRDREAYGFLSNFHASPITLDGETWPTVEHYYQAQKCTDPDYQQAIRTAATPGQSKRLGASPTAPRRMSRQSWFRRHGKEPRGDWNDMKLAVMRRAVQAKFTQHADLAARLLATGTAELVEDSLTDAFWGTGARGQGENWLGRVLMEVRDELATAEVANVDGLPHEQRGRENPDGDIHPLDGTGLLRSVRNELPRGGGDRPALQHPYPAGNLEGCSSRLQPE